jgi:hypothetical protein
MLKSENLKRLILLSVFARWPATPAHPCTALTQRGLRSQIVELRHTCILTKCMFRLPKSRSKNRLCEPKSIGRTSEREKCQCSSYKKTATKSAINCQSKASLQSSAIESKHNYFNFGVPQFPGTACMQPTFLCLPWHDVSLYIHTIVEYSFQPQYVFDANIVLLRFIINVWFNGVRFNSMRFTR